MGRFIVTMKGLSGGMTHVWRPGNAMNVQGRGRKGEKSVSAYGHNRRSLIMSRYGGFIISRYGRHCVVRLKRDEGAHYRPAAEKRE